MTGPQESGFFSGFHAVDTVLASPPTYSLLVNDTDPIFFYCGAINPNATTNVTKQHEQALNSVYMLNPGEPFPAESPLPSNLPSGTAMPGMGMGGGRKGMGGGAIAGIVIAALAVIVLAALLFFFWGRTKSLKDEVDRKAGTVCRVSPDSSTNMLDASRPQGNGLGYQNYQQHSATSPPPMEHAYGYGTPGYGTPNSSTPAPSYFSPQQRQDRLDQMSPVSHPTRSPPPMGNTVNINRALSHRSVGGTFELSPPGDYSRTHEPRVMSPHCIAAADQEAKLGPYGQQVYGNTTQTHGGTTAEAIPSYFETVYRPGPMHVNSQVGPAEIDGKETARSLERMTPAQKPAWEEL
jgi:hypothetical protein